MRYIVFLVLAALASAVAPNYSAGAETVPRRMLAETFAHFLPPAAPGAVMSPVERHWMPESRRRGIVAAATYRRGPAAARIWIGFGNPPDEAAQRESVMPAPMLPAHVTRETVRGFPALVERRALPGEPHFRHIRIALPNGIAVHLHGEFTDADYAHYIAAIDLTGLAVLQPR